MRVLMLPYLSFKDYRKSSGIIHQIELAKALAHVLPEGGVTVLLPKQQDGWDYPEILFEGYPNLSVYQVDFLRDYDVAAGAITETMARALTPERSSIPFDVVFCGVPAAALGLRRYLSKAGFDRYTVPVVNYYDIVKVPEEARERGSVTPDLARDFRMLETAGAAQSYSIVHTESEARAVHDNLRKVISPFMARDAMVHRVYRIDRPYQPPNGVVKRYRKGEEYRIFVARSFGPSREESGQNTTPLIEAIGYLRARGVPVRMVLATQSPMVPWTEEWLSLDSVEVMHQRPRGEVMAALYDCEMSAYLCDYNGLYMSSVEAITSGSPHIFKKSRWSEGEIETPWMVSDCCSFTSEVKGKAREDLITELMALISKMVETYDDVAETSFQLGKKECHEHSYTVSGVALLNVLKYACRAENEDWDYSKFKSMAPLFDQSAEAGEFDGVTLQEATEAVERRMDTGRLGRYSVSWVARVLENMGYSVTMSDGTWVVHKEGIGERQFGT